MINLCIRNRYVGKVRIRRLGEYSKSYPTSDMCTKQWTNTKLSSRCKDQKYVTFTFIELPEYIRSVFAEKKWQVSVSSFDLCQNQVSVPLSQRSPLEHLFILVQRKRIWEAPSSLLANNPTVDAIQNIIKQIPAHKKSQQNFIF